MKKRSLEILQQEQIKEIPLASSPPTKSLEQYLEEFIADQDVTAASRRTYKSSLHQFFSWFIQSPTARPTRETILDYKEWLDQKGLQPFTRAGYLVAVRRFFEWAEGKKLYPNIAKGIKGARRLVKAHQKSSLSVAQIQELLATIDQSTLEGKRDFALINLLCRTGLRLIEVKRSLVGDLEKRDHETALLWIRGKGRDGKDDFVVLTTDAFSPLTTYLEARKATLETAPLFASLSDRNYGKGLTTFSLSRLIKKRLRSIGLKSKRFSAHSLRHTFGVLAISAGASLYEVQLAMRHTAPTTTEIYLGDIERQKRLEGGPERRITDLLKKR